MGQVMCCSECKEIKDEAIENRMEVNLEKWNNEYTKNSEHQ